MTSLINKVSDNMKHKPEHVSNSGNPLTTIKNTKQPVCPVSFKIQFISFIVPQYCVPLTFNKIVRNKSYRIWIHLFRSEIIPLRRGQRNEKKRLKTAEPR